MAALVAAASNPDYPAEIALVVSNRVDAAGLKNAAAAGVATMVVDHREFGNDREAFERTIHATLETQRIELVCLAGFMRMLTPWFVERWDGRLINIHPSLLPAFKGLDTHARALKAGVRIHGASVHFVTAEVDSGAIVAQAAVPVLDADTPESLAARVLKAEHRLYPLALKLIAEDRVRIVNGRCAIDGAPSAEALLIAPDLG
jgi:phosphoribosylglycinamide formyltransferase-1